VPIAERAQVPATKLRRPVLTSDHVRRTRLLTSVAPSGPRTPLVTTVVAAAGSGKTVLLGQTAGVLRRRGALTPWLSLDKDDNDPFLLWSGILASLSETVPPDEVGPFLDIAAPGGPAGNAFLAALSAALEEIRRPVCFVLDDAHELRTGPALEGLSRLMMVAPDGVSFLLGCRREPSLPLARWTVEGRTRRLSQAELNFDRDEAATLLRAHSRTIGAPDLDRLLDRTEGWATGLRFAALALRDAADPRAYVAAFAGDQRPVADYLVGEVLDGLAPDVRQFLLTTSVVDPLPTDLARELTERPDAGAVLDRLDRDNALVNRLDATRTGYRYHALLRDYLASVTARESAETVRSLHRAAAAWFLRNGRPSENLSHLVAAEDWTDTALLLARNGVELLMAGHGPAVTRALTALPPPYRARPEVALIAAHLALLEGDPATARPDIALAAADGALPDDPRQRVLLASALLSEARLLGDRAEHVDDLIARTTENAPGAPELDLLATVTRAMSLVERRRFLAADTELARARDLATALGYDYLALQCMAYLTLSASAMSKYIEMNRRAEQTFGFARERGWGRSAALLPAYAMAAWSAWLFLDLAAIDRYTAEASRITALAEPQVLLGLKLVRAYADHERTADARTLEKATRAAWTGVDERAVSPTAASPFCLTDLRAALDGGLTSWVEDVMARAGRFLAGRGDLAVVHALQQLRTGRPSEARKSLRPVLAGTATTTASALIAGWLMEAEIAQARGEPDRQHSALLAALDIAEPLTMLRSFVEAPQALDALRTARGRLGGHETFVERLLTAATARVSSMPTGTGVPDLTERELEILRALPSLLSIDSIAIAHQLSANTVKSHVQSVYRKLSVHGRREAVARARELRLL
jgi:LuxR family transcriptional regulator, maltose regulon positive regulatory protein